MEHEPHVSDRDAIKARYSELAKQLLGKIDPIEYHERRSALARRLQEKYPDAKNRAWYHWLIGSTPPPTATPEDFPGEDSVEHFLESLVQE